MRVLKNHFYSLIAMLILGLIVSCQESISETTVEDNETQIKSNTRLFELLEHIALKDGSKDNIIDGANNITVVLPVTVIVNGIEIEVATENDFQLIENAIEASSDDDDEVQIKFPIDIMLSDYTQVTISNQSEFDKYLSESTGEDEYDEDIECIDFKYPLMFEALAFNASIPTTIVISTDAELFALLNNLNHYNAVQFSFPVTLILFDDTEFNVNSLDSLESAIENTKDSCDEDDDFDYDDDDEAVLFDFLTNGNWIIEEYISDDDDFTEDYNGYIFSFNSSMEVNADNGESTVSGKWVVDRDSSNQFIVLDFGAVVPFEVLNKRWKIREIEVDILELEIGSEMAGDLKTLVFEKIEPEL